MYSLQVAYLIAVLFLHTLHLGFQVINSLVPFGNFLTQFVIGLLQFLHFPAAEKRTHSACYNRGSIGSRAFELVRAYLRFYLSEFLFGKVYLLFLMPLYGFYTLQFGFLFLNDEVVPFQIFPAESSAKQRTKSDRKPRDDARRLSQRPSALRK